MFARQTETWGARLGVTEDERAITPAAKRSRALRLLRRGDGTAGARNPRAARGRAQSRRAAARPPVSTSIAGLQSRRAGRCIQATSGLSGADDPIDSEDPTWLARFFKDDLEGASSSRRPLSVQDVWPENYSANSVQKVWAAKFAARHPNVVVLDLSSFKCGHDAPTYGLIDSIINSSGTPASALHDIDANKPGGSIKIRVKTYAHTLKRFEEDLADAAARRSELERRVDARRRELLRARHARLKDAARADGRATHALRELEAAFASYLEEDTIVPEAADAARSDIAPLPPVTAVAAMVFHRRAPSSEAKL